MPNTISSPFVILTGASGVGKTTIARAVSARHPEIAVYMEDNLHQPPEDFVASIGPTKGPGGPFQRGFALYWIGRIAEEVALSRPVLLDSQCRIAFLQEALRLHKLTKAKIVLVECDDCTRDGRLHGRGSPHLAHEEMRNWSRYLHKEAISAGSEILDTGALSLNESVARVVGYLQA